MHLPFRLADADANIPQDKSNTAYEYFVDIKSEGLQDILRENLKEVKGVSLREDKPTVRKPKHV